MSHRYLCRPSLLVFVVVALLISFGSVAQAQTVSGDVAGDHLEATALKAMALWEGAPAVFVDRSDDGVFLGAAQIDGAYGLFRFDHVLHVPGSPDVEGSYAYRQLVGQYRRAFSDLQLTVDDGIEDRDTVMLRWTMNGTHTGTFGEFAPTGAQFQITGVTVFRIANEAIAETWFMPDALGLTTQLAADPVV